LLYGRRSLYGRAGLLHDGVVTTQRGETFMETMEFDLIGVYRGFAVADYFSKAEFPDDRLDDREYLVLIEFRAHGGGNAFSVRVLLDGRLVPENRLIADGRKKAHELLLLAADAAAQKI
jgi:hypothetical protein